MQAGQSARALDDIARSTLDSQAGRTLTEPEWVAMRSRLVKVAVTLREWDRRAKAAQPELGNVDELCQPEP
jgi:hypothetical protein